MDYVNLELSATTIGDIRLGTMMFLEKGHVKICLPFSIDSYADTIDTYNYFINVVDSNQLKMSEKNTNLVIEKLVSVKKENGSGVDLEKYKKIRGEMREIYKTEIDHIKSFFRPTEFMPFPNIEIFDRINKKLYDIILIAEEAYKRLDNNRPEEDTYYFIGSEVVDGEAVYALKEIEEVEASAIKEMDGLREMFISVKEYREVLRTPNNEPYDPLELYIRFFPKI